MDSGSEGLLCQCLMRARSANDRGDKAWIAGKGASIEGPLDDAAGKAEHGKGQCDAGRILQVTGVNGLVVECSDGRALCLESGNAFEQSCGVMRPGGENDMGEALWAVVQAPRVPIGSEPNRTYRLPQIDLPAMSLDVV